MKRTMIVMLGALVLAPQSWADSVMPAQNLSDYLTQLQIKLEHTAQRVNQPTASGSSVVGLRGSKQEPLSKQLYWKGKTGTTPVSPDEVKMFRTAIEEAKAGNKDQALGTLKSFQEKYPASGLKGDADDTIALLASAKP